MAPRGERGAKEGAWVKKSDATAKSEKTESTAADDEEKKTNQKGERRPRQPREARGRRPPLDKDATEDPAGDVKGSGRGRGGRGWRGGQRRAPQQAATQEDTSGEEDGEELTGAALLTLLKANPPKATRYTKGELLSIAHLPASNIKPPDLSPLIDKENKDSQLLLRPTGGRALGTGEDDEDLADASVVARKEAKDRRKGRRQDQHAGEQGGSEDDKDHRPIPEGAAWARAESPADAVGTSAPSSPNRTPAAATPAVPSPEKLPATTPKAPLVEKEIDGPMNSRAFDKWFDRSKLDKAATGTVGTPTSQASAAAGTGPPSLGATLPTTGQSGKSATPSPADLLQAMTNAASRNAAANAMQNLAAQNQAQVQLQAALHFQNLQQAMYQAAASKGGNYPGLPWGYNPYAFPGYPNPYGAAYGAPPLDYSIPPQSAASYAGHDAQKTMAHNAALVAQSAAQTAALQHRAAAAGLGQRMAPGPSATSKATAAALRKTGASAANTTPQSPSLAASLAPSTAVSTSPTLGPSHAALGDPPLAANMEATTGTLAESTVAASAATLPAGVDGSVKPDDEDDGGCEQS